MKRRNFLGTAAAAAVSTVLPERAAAKGAVLTGVDWGAPEGDRRYNYDDNVTRMCRHLNPVEFFKALCGTCSDTGVLEIHSTGHHAIWIEKGGQAISRCPYVPCVTPAVAAQLADLMPTGIMHGRHIYSSVVHDAIYWTIGAQYAETRYVLPDGTVFGFAMGELQSPVCKFPRKVEGLKEERSKDVLGREVDFWLHVRGNFVQEYLQSPQLWGDEPGSKFRSSVTFGKSKTT